MGTTGARAYGKARPRIPTHQSQSAPKQQRSATRLGRFEELGHYEDKHFEENDGNLNDWCWVAPGSEAVLDQAIRTALLGTR